MTHGISALADFMKNVGVAGVFIYSFFEKFLIPTGLYHFVWSPFQPTQIGGTLNVDGQVVSGTQTILLAYMRHPNLMPVMNDILRFSQQGTTTVFGLAGASPAFCHTAKPEKKVMAKAILLPAITTSMLAGITEPIELTFLFISSLLWVVHVTPTAASQAIRDIFTVRLWGAPGLTEFLIYSLPLPASLMRWSGCALIDTGQLAAYYVIFRTLVVRLSLKTPSREDDENMKFYSKMGYRQKVVQPQSIIDNIIRGLEGKENILSVNNCSTRLHVAVRGIALIDDAQLKDTSASGIARNRSEVQVIYGIKAEQVCSRVNN